MGQPGMMAMQLPGMTQEQLSGFGQMPGMNLGGAGMGAPGVGQLQQLGPGLQGGAWGGMSAPGPERMAGLMPAIPGLHPEAQLQVLQDGSVVQVLPDGSTVPLQMPPMVPQPPYARWLDDHGLMVYHPEPLKVRARVCVCVCGFRQDEGTPVGPSRRLTRSSPGASIIK